MTIVGREDAGRDERVAARAAGNVLAVNVPAVPASIGPVRRAVSAFAAVYDTAPHLRADIALAVSEAVTNAILHGHGGGDAQALIHVVVDYEEDALEVVVADSGIGLDADVRSAGLGLGLGLIARSAARFAARPRDPAGTEIWMRFEI